ncbi:hypothetical protein HMPREF9151_02609 [Hoylesella saccharolytica F0055]|uniref:Uncharacterized protein n=1 Tax=Hoylesella saccharolytica F0055 TaxID=1127699 RepID=L1MY66_9BACT|nr:hypothetical protein HMPREF9151_02609 [Hoylesella saccharolytica F0055]
MLCDVGLCIYRGTQQRYEKRLNDANFFLRKCRVNVNENK